MDILEKHHNHGVASATPFRISYRDLVFALIVAGLWFGLLIYLMLHETGGKWSALLDDVYIHFQYAKRLAEGHFYSYSNGDGFSKGATSFLYPLLLAPGWLLGFQGEWMTLWALLLALAATTGSYYFIIAAARRLGNPWVGRITVLLMAMTTELQAGIYSGMEVGIALFVLVLWVYTLVRIWTAATAGESPRGIFVAHLLIAAVGPMLRPELIAASGGTMLLILVSRFRPAALGGIKAPWATLAVPLLGQISLMVLYWVMTGSTAGNAMLSKSFFYEPGITVSRLLRITFANYKTFGFDVLFGLYKYPFFAPLFAVLSLLGIAVMITWKGLWRRLALLLILVGTVYLFIPQLTYTVSWGMYRYCQPFFPWLLLPVAALFVHLVRNPSLLRRFAAAAIALYLMLFFALVNYPEFSYEYAQGTNNLSDQQRAMGEYIAKTYKDKPVVIGINDAGAIPYFSDKPAFDLLGLVTQNMAVCFRWGNACTWEYMSHLPKNHRPTHWAVYPGWWKNDKLMGKMLHTTSSRNRISMGGVIKRLYKADWSEVDKPDTPLHPPKGLALVDQLDIGYSVDEKSHDYSTTKKGKAFDSRMSFHTYSYQDKASKRTFTEGGRVIGRGQQENFTIHTIPGKPLTIVMRTDAYYGMNLSVKTDAMDKPIPWKQDKVGKHWVDAGITLPASAITGDTTRIHIKCVDKDYAPFHYWFYQ